MIFVTVGNGKFDPLIKEIDRLIGSGSIKDQVVMQIGHGRYHPQHCESFQFKSTLEHYFDQADLVISHGGPGSVFDVLRKGKKLIALPNRDRTDPRHQVEYLRAMAQETSGLIYCDHVELLASCLKKAKTHRFTQYKPSTCRMGEIVKEFLK